MRIGYFAAILACLCGIVSPANAQENIKYSGSFTTGIYDHYFGANGSVFAEEPVLQSELDVNASHGKFYSSLILWNSKGFKENWKTFSDEVDFIGLAGYAGPVNVLVTVGEYALVPIARSNVLTAGFKLSKEVKLGKNSALTPFGSLDWYWPTNSYGPQSGKFAKVGLVHSLEFSKRVGIANQLLLIRDIDGAFGFRPKTNVLRYDLGLPTRALGLTLTPKFTYAGALENDRKRPTKSTYAFVASYGW